MHKLKLFGATLVCALVESVSAATIDFESATTGACNVRIGGAIDGFTLSAYNGITSLLPFRG
jgi:hypothetical protein